MTHDQTEIVMEIALFIALGLASTAVLAIIILFTAAIWSDL